METTISGIQFALILGRNYYNLKGLEAKFQMTLFMQRWHCRIYYGIRNSLPDQEASIAAPSLPGARVT